MDDSRESAGKTKPADDPSSRDLRDEDPKTRLAGLPDFARNVAPGDTASDDPVVGWVVIVDGPGKGRSFPLGYGMNDIGRSAEARVRLDYGDPEIARQQHALLTFDPRSTKFFVQHGGGKNLTYLSDAPVLTPQELHSGQEIVLGRTRLRFVALCGPDFDWQKRG
jgi:hypothetical protein